MKIAVLNTNTFTNDKHLFCGWADSAGGDVIYENGGPFTMNTQGHTLYAIWNYPRELLAPDAQAEDWLFCCHQW